MSQSNDQSNLPVRAIHESWLDMMRALKAFYRAENAGSDAQVSGAQSNLQHEVLAFFEMLRPYLESGEPGTDYWRGRPPGYGDDDTGAAVLSWQDHTRVVQPDQLSWPEDASQPLSRRAMHNQLDLGENVRIINRSYEENRNGGAVIFVVRVYETGLKKLDNWHQTRSKREVDKGGFLKGKKDTEVTSNTVGARKLVNAARSLENAARELGFLADIGTVVETDPTPI